MLANKDIFLFEDRRRVLLAANEFVCLCPHPGLENYISSYNITFPTKKLMPGGFTVMPSGCATLSIEHSGGGLYACLEGPVTRPCVVGGHTGALEMLLTLEFKPAGLYAFTGIGQWELADKTIPLDAVDPELCRLVCEAVEGADSVAGLAADLDRLLLASIQRAGHPQLLFTLQGIAGSAGNISVKGLAEGVHYSERQLNRIYKQQVGVSAKAFSRLVRINGAFRLLKRPGSSLALVSDMLGYHDASHFIRDFKLVCGMTPQEYRENMSVFYTNTARF